MSPPSLISFLRQCRSHLHHGTAAKPILVIGNPSADLDSFASAVLYAFYHSLPPNTRPHIPILNVSFPARDLRRQRPEYATALEVRRDGYYYTSGWEERRSKKKKLDDTFFQPDDDGGVLEEVLTRHDLLEMPRFSSEEMVNGPLDAILVDWNSLAGDSNPPRLTGSHVSVAGCVDHHIDEHFVPERGRAFDSGYEPPRVIETAGSCTSLVIRHLQDSSLWPSSRVSGPSETRPSEEEDAQLVQLALAAILIDTTNLQSKHKTTDVDVAAVESLEKAVSRPDWDREKFFSELDNAKTRGLELLTLEEVLGKDYKEWDIPSSSGKMGIASVVLPLKTLAFRASSSSSSPPPPFLSSKDVQCFLDVSESYADLHSLSVFCIMTASTPGNEGFQRELFLFARTSDAARRLSEFVESEGTRELQLEPWNSNEVEGLDGDGLLQGKETADVGAGWRVAFWQRDLSKSRKQVAPLLRKALGEKMDSRG